MTTTTSAQTLDGALAAIHRYDEEYGGGLANHAPMVAESLDHAGLAGEIGPWLAEYGRHLDPAAPFAGEPADPALGGTGWAEATTYFERRLADSTWQAVLGEWAPRLIPGAVAAAGHGLLRTADAVRSLERVESDERISELAHGLGYWVASYAELPGSPSVGSLTLGDALGGIPMTDAHDVWFISDRVRLLDPATFGSAVAAARLPDDPDDALTAVIDLALRVLATNPSGEIAFVHTVTVPSAARHLVRHVSPELGREIAEQAWWVLAGLWSTYGGVAPLDSYDDAPSWNELLAAALASGDEHDIKLTIAARDQSGRVDDALARTAVATLFT